MRCFLLCDSCKEKTTYIKGSENKCTFCKRIVKIEEEIENLVIVLNNAGVFTSASCEGHKDGFDFGKRGYPCVVILNEKTVYEKAVKIVESYNKIKEQDNCFFWAIKHELTLSGWKPFIFPEKKNLEGIYKEVLLFAKYIEGLF